MASFDQAIEHTLAITELAEGIELALKSRSAMHYIPVEHTNQRTYSCIVSACPNKAFAKGYCNAHYIRQRLGRSLELPLRNYNRTAHCSLCGGPTRGKGGWGLCSRHYKHERRTVIKRTLIDYFGGSCATCTRTFHPSVFDFHHRGEKLDSLSYLIDNADVLSIAQEAIQCSLLCANCHREIHYVNIRSSH